jgi:hypothetical protein
MFCIVVLTYDLQLFYFPLVSDSGAWEGTFLVQNYHLVLARDVTFHQTLRHGQWCKYQYA